VLLEVLLVLVSGAGRSDEMGEGESMERWRRGEGGLPEEGGGRGAEGLGRGSGGCEEVEEDEAEEEEGEDDSEEAERARSDESEVAEEGLEGDVFGDGVEDGGQGIGRGSGERGGEGRVKSAWRIGGVGQSRLERVVPLEEFGSVGRLVVLLVMRTTFLVFVPLHLRGSPAGEHRLLLPRSQMMRRRHVLMHRMAHNCCSPGERME